MSNDHDTTHQEVRQIYASAARTAQSGRAASDGGDPADWGPNHFYEDLDGLPERATLASLGCGNPVAVADLHPGDVVLDLGSGGGIDVLLSARRVGSSGFVYGLDMTEEMLDLARANAAEANTTNVEFLRGQIEAIPLPDRSVDVVISNCVINLSPDKHAVFAEAFRVLRNGGRFGVSDVVTDDDLTDDERIQRSASVGCVVGALPISAYVGQLEQAGFLDVSVTTTHTVGEGVHSAIIRAAKP
jgi:arsenite methyltransferase